MSPPLSKHNSLLSVLVTYIYDAASNLVTATYPNGLVSTLAYDAVNRMTSLSTANSSISPVASYNYAPLGVSNKCEIEWPPKSNRHITIPEVDRGAWFTPEAAAKLIREEQRPFLERLESQFRNQ